MKFKSIPGLDFFQFLKKRFSRWQERPRIARPTSALSPCALSRAHCRGSREMHGSRRDARLYARFAGAARYLHSSPELSRLSLRFREYSVKARNFPIISQCERALCKKNVHIPQYLQMSLIICKLLHKEQ